ncbi:MAG: hypothetical protein PHX61_04760 [Alphaproteobacteria bacterium]|nr:hypothetical protein [Alphaproteobacteria bacterium]
MHKIHKSRFEMSVLKGKIHHMAKGASGAAVVAGSGAVVVVAVAVAAGVAAAGVVEKTYKCAYTIPADTQKTWQRCGAGLLATFSLACGIGAGTLVSNHLPKNDNNAPQTKQTTPTTGSFNVKAGETDECIIVVKKGQASTLSGSCEISPAPL